MVNGSGWTSAPEKNWYDSVMVEERTVPLGSGVLEVKDPVTSELTPGL
jgi:hypothetical protein